MSTFLTYGSFFSWFVVGPVLLIEGVGISSEEFGQLMCLWVGLAFLAGGFLNGRLVTSSALAWIVYEKMVQAEAKEALSS